MLAATVILVAVRLWETVMDAYFKNTSIWRSIRNDSFDHYQLGLILMSLGFILSKWLGVKKKAVIMGVGAGLLIDESYQVFAALSGSQYIFNGITDWLFVIIVYATLYAFYRIRTRKRQQLVIARK